MYRKLHIILIVSVLVMFNQPAYARFTIDYSVHANIIYRFTKYVNWPEYKKTGDFVIGVVGETPLYDELVALTRNKRVGSQPIVVKSFSEDARAYNCHILFVSEDESSSLKRISNATAGKPVLLVAENNGLIYKGACINFIIIGENLKLEFGTHNIERRDLQIASELLNLGTVIN